MSGNDRNVDDDGDGDGDGEGAMVWVRPSRHEEAILISRCVRSGPILHQCPSYAQPPVSCSARQLGVRRVVVAAVRDHSNRRKVFVLSVSPCRC
jgi:hypothetical protein